MSRGGNAKVKEPEAVILKRRRRLRDREAAKSLVLKIFTLVIAVLVMFGVIFGITPMKGGDMEPKLSAGDLLVYYRLEKNFNRNDVVIMERDGNQYVGRLIGLPGDTINISPSGGISIDGNNIFETGIFYETKPYEGSGRYPLGLAENDYFLLADKRDTAKDSRYFGPVKREEIKGKVISSVKRTGI